MKPILTALLVFALATPTTAVNLTTKEYFSQLSPEQRRAYVHGVIDMAILGIRLKESTKQAICLSEWFAHKGDAYEQDLNTFLRANSGSQAATIIDIFVRTVRECHDDDDPPIPIPLPSHKPSENTRH